MFLLTAALVVATGATSAMANTTGSSKSTQPHPKMETMKMTHMGLFVRLDAKPGKEAALEKFLKRPGFSGGSFHWAMQPYRGSRGLHSNCLRPQRAGCAR